MKDNHDITTERDVVYLERARNGDEEAIEALLEAYKPLVLSRASQYFLPSQERDDLIQEGMIALFRAILKCPRERFASFSAYAFQAVNNRLIDIVRREYSQKMRAILGVLSLDADRGDFDSEKGVTLEAKVEGNSGNPEGILLQKEAVEALYDRIQQSLSSQEREVLLAFSAGQTYKEIAANQGLTEKSVDSSLQRARHKLKDFRKEVEF